VVYQVTTVYLFTVVYLVTTVYLVTHGLPGIHGNVLMSLVKFLESFAKNCFANNLVQDNNGNKEKTEVP